MAGTRFRVEVAMAGCGVGARGARGDGEQRGGEGKGREGREGERERERRGEGRRGMDGCKSGEISKPGWELSSSGQHHGWRVELECLPTPHTGPNPTAILPP